MGASSPRITHAHRGPRDSPRRLQSDTVPHCPTRPSTPTLNFWGPRRSHPARATSAAAERLVPLPLGSIGLYRIRVV